MKGRVDACLVFTQTTVLFTESDPADLCVNWEAESSSTQEKQSLSHGESFTFLTQRKCLPAF